MWLLAVALFGLASLCIFKWFSKPKGASPWLNWAAIPPPRPLETDQKKRDAVIKQSFRPGLVEGQTWDAVVVGSGMGGLSTAALLSRAGWKCLVLEQHDQAGGCCHSFLEKGFEFDVGIHYVGNTLDGAPFRAFLDQITDGQLDWVPTDRHYDKVYLGPAGEHRIHPIPSGSRAEVEAELLAQFPDEGPAIRAFLAKLQATEAASSALVLPKLLPLWLCRLLDALGVFHLLTPYFKESTQSLLEVTQSLTDNKELQAVFAYCFGDFGEAPSEAPWTMQAALWNHYRRGAGYPLGGSSQVAHSLIPVIEAGGGRVLVRAPVAGIRLEAGRAVGVDVGGKFPATITAGVVISDAGVVNTFSRLLPQEIATKSRYHRYIQDIGSGDAALQLFVGLNGTSKELELGSYNAWAFPNEDVESCWQNFTMGASLQDVLDGKAELPVLFISFPSAKDPTYETRFPGKAAATVVSFCPWQWFQQWDGSKHGKRSDDYKRTKKELAHIIWQRVLKYFPQLEGRDECMKFGSPLTTQHYIGSQKGEVYGLHHGRSRFTPRALADLRPETDVRGLWLTGQDVMCCGVAGAAYGGLLCAGELLGRKTLIMDPAKLRKQRAAMAKAH